MKILVTFDSVYGNTQKIAQEIADTLKVDNQVRTAHISEVIKKDLDEIDLIIIGSPTHGGRPTVAIQEFAKGLDPNWLSKIKVAVFDTRVSFKEQNLFLKVVMKLIDYAAPKLAQTLSAKGATLILEPKGFMVADKKGPLKAGELQQVKAWLSSL